VLALILALLLIFVLFGVGFSLHLLWIVAAVIAVIWLLGFIFTGAGGGRWYRW